MEDKKKKSYEAPPLIKGRADKNFGGFILLWFVGLVGGVLFISSNSNVSPDNTCQLFGDYPFLGLRTFSASRFQLLEGPYSRLNFSHPSPLLFYFFALIDSLLPIKEFQALAAGQFIVNWVCLGLGAAALYRTTSTHPLIVCIVTASVLFYSATDASPYILVDFWNPQSLILPGMSFAIGLQAFLLEDRKSSLCLGLSAAILFSQHLSTALLVLLIYLLVITFELSNPKRKVISSQERMGLFLPLALACTPLIIDLLLNAGNSNPARILSYLLEGSSSQHSLVSVKDFLLDSVLTPITGIALFTATVILAFLCTKTRKAGIALAIAVIPSIFLLYACLHSPGRLQPYLFSPLYGFILFAICQAVLLATGELTKKSGEPQTALPFIAMFVLLLLVLPTRVSSLVSLPCEPPRWVSGQAIAAKQGLVSIAAYKMHGWDQAGAFAFRLLQNKAPFCFAPKFRKYVSRHLICSRNQLRSSTQAIFARKTDQVNLVGDALVFDKASDRFTLYIVPRDSR